MANVLKGIARLRVPAGKAKPSPAIGQALGPLGVNMMEFCKQFNARSEKFVDDVPMRVRLNAYEVQTHAHYACAALVVGCPSHTPLFATTMDILLLLLLLLLFPPPSHTPPPHSLLHTGSLL